VRHLVEYSFDRDDFRPRDDSLRDRAREEAQRSDSARFDAAYDDYMRQAEMEREREAVREVVNNPNITITPSMVAAINDPSVEMMPNMQITRRRSSRGPGQFDRSRILPGTKQSKRTRRKTKMDKSMSAALKQANAKLRKKNGQLRKGKTMKDVMKMAHRLCKKK